MRERIQRRNLFAEVNFNKKKKIVHPFNEMETSTAALSAPSNIMYAFYELIHINSRIPTWVCTRRT